MRIDRKRDMSRLRNAGTVLQMKTMNRVEEKLRAHTLIEILVRSPEAVESRAFCKKLAGGGAPRELVNGKVSFGRIRRGNDPDQLHQRSDLASRLSVRCSANSSTI